MTSTASARALIVTVASFSIVVMHGSIGRADTVVPLEGIPVIGFQYGHEDGVLPSTLYHDRAAKLYHSSRLGKI